MLDLKRRTPDLRLFVRDLEAWVIAALALLGISAFRREGRVGIWVEHGLGEAKIAAIGVRVRRWVSWHGISINVDPELDHFTGIVPCGIAEHGVTSLRALGLDADMATLDAALAEAFPRVFGSGLEVAVA